MLVMNAKQIWWFLGEGGCGSFLWLSVFIFDSDKCGKFLNALSRHEKSENDKNVDSDEKIALSLN